VLNTTDTSTDVYLRPEFADRLTVKNLDGRQVGGWFAEDFTLAEVKQLNAIERIPAIRGTEFNNDGLKVPTLAEVIDLVQAVEAETGRKIGIYPETKHPTFFEQQGYNTSEILVETLVAEGFTDPSRVFIQSFEVSNLKELNDTIMPADGIDIPLVQLFGSGGQPYDFVVAGDARTYTDLSTPTGLAEIAEYAAGIGPNKQRIVPLSTVDADGNSQPDDLNGDGVISDGDRVTGAPTTLIQDAHDSGLLVHLYTLRNDSFFLPNSYEGDPLNEYKQFIELGVDGFFSDFPGTGFTARSTFLEEPAVANLNRSQGFEGMAFSPDRTTLYPMLEGTVVGDPAGSLRIYEFDIASAAYEGLVGLYQLESTRHAIGEITPINANEFLVIERDGGQGETAEFKKIFKVDFSDVDSQGFVGKEEVVDLLNLKDPNDLNGDGETTFDFPFVTIESVLVLDADTILVANDNNYPFSVGRGPDIDNNEIIEIQLDKPLNLDARLGVAGLTPAPVAELVDLTGFDGNVAVNVIVTREAAFDNVLRFYKTDAQGQVDGLLPGQAGYEEAVAANLLDAELFVTNNTASDLNLTLTGGTYYAPALLINGSLSDLATIDDAVLGSSRIQREGNVWSFEDLTNNDFNDLVVTLKSAEPVAA
jgi:glycerophosphoryl diester phosphodiesterase